MAAKAAALEVAMVAEARVAVVTGRRWEGREAATVVVAMAAAMAGEVAAAMAGVAKEAAVEALCCHSRRL